MAKNKKAKSEKNKKPSATSASRAKKEIGLPLRYSVISGTDQMKVSRSEKGILEDLSMSGLAFQVSSMRKDELHLSYDKSPVIRNKLALEIDLPTGRRFTAMEEVSWYEKSFVEQDELYHVGVTFTDINLEERGASRST